MEQTNKQRKIKRIKEYNDKIKLYEKILSKKQRRETVLSKEYFTLINLKLLQEKSELRGYKQAIEDLK